MELTPDRFDVDGVAVVAGEDRRGERLVSHYRVGRRSVLWVDPELAAEVAEVAEVDGRRLAMSFDEFRAVATDRGAEVLGHGLEHLLPGAFEYPTTESGVEVLDGTDPGVVELVGELLAECSDGDRDEADFDVAALDRFLVGWVAPDGRLLALAGGRDFDARPGFVDVGVLVHPDARGAGKGSAVIAGVVAEVLAAGEIPLYRCGDHNLASRRLCSGLGFEVVLELEAYRWPE